MTLRDELPSRWRPLFQVLGELDDGIAAAYAELGIEGVRPRFSMALMFLDSEGPMTIRRLADECGVTHSAMSQSVTQMRSAGLVESAPGPDAHERYLACGDPCLHRQSRRSALPAVYQDICSERRLPGHADPCPAAGSR